MISSLDWIFSLGDGSFSVGAFWISYLSSIFSFHISLEHNACKRICPIKQYFNMLMLNTHLKPTNHKLQLKTNEKSSVKSINFLVICLDVLRNC
ncbi:hypothetical protein DB44_CU00080 [Candidatus Protochlamydia amoebophila]|uniref:Uncharacterized protein n=1 Tax=Candidatus Protochlamydia amoebophila TaxID=362787 RepID=A0A0C1JN37_9BACT|nr:hypothetical protein DB44_CU00080 [Candidatus Protochlamydia amoebophila]